MVLKTYSIPIRFTFFYTQFQNKRNVVLVNQLSFPSSTLITYLLSNYLCAHCVLGFQIVVFVRELVNEFYLRVNL